MCQLINDYELIYLFQMHQDDIALECLIGKYERMIWKYIHLFNVSLNDQSDYYQEGIMLLHKAVAYFDENKNKTFTRYFELILKRRFFRLKNKEPKYVLQEEKEFFERLEYEEEIEFKPLNLILKNEIEKSVYQLHIIEGHDIKKVSLKTGYTHKQIYNAVYRIKEKYKAMI